MAVFDKCYTPNSELTTYTAYHGPLKVTINRYSGDYPDTMDVWDSDSNTFLIVDKEIPKVKPDHVMMEYHYGKEE